MDFTAAGTDHRRRVAAAARQRLSVLDHATHYTSTTYSSEPRVVDHGHGGDDGGYGAEKKDVVDRPLGSRVPSHRAVQDSPPRAPQGTAGVRIRAAAGADSYASLYEEHLGADAMAHPGVSWDRPETQTRRWAGDVETKLGEVSAFLERAALDDGGVGWEDARRPRASSPSSVRRTDAPSRAVRDSRDPRLRPDASWSPRRPQTYVREETVRDVDDGHGGAWRRAALPASPGVFDDAAERSGTHRRDSLNTTRRASDRTPLNDRPEWNGELYVPEEPRREEVRRVGGEDERARDDAFGAKQPERGSGENARTRAFETPSFRDADRAEDDDAENDARGGAVSEGTPFRRAFDGSNGVGERSAGASAASKLAALKDRRAARRPRASREPLVPAPSRGRGALEREDARHTLVRFDENAPIHGPTRASDGKGSNWGAGGAPSEFPTTSSSASAARARKTTDALGETWGEFGTTLRPQPRTTRTGLKLASDRKLAPKTRPMTNEKNASPVASSGGLGRARVSETETETANAFGERAPPRDRSHAHGERLFSSSPSSARVSSGSEYPSTDLPPDMRGASVPEGADVGPSALSPCDTCGRKFNARALAIHSRSCAKVFATKRKAFDVAKQRAAGTELERFRRVGGGGTALDDDAGGFGFGGGLGGKRLAKPRAGAAAARRAPPASQTDAGPTPRWKMQSERFRAGLRAGRTGQAIDAGHDEGLVPCPHCGRSFNEQAAERHIPQCTNIRAKPSRLVRGGGRGAHVAARPGGGGMGWDHSKTRAF